MQVRTVLRGLVVTTVLAVLTALLPQLASAAPGKASGRYLVVARSAADLTALRAKAGEGGRQGRHIDAAGQGDGDPGLGQRAPQPGRRQPGRWRRP